MPLKVYHYAFHVFLGWQNYVTIGPVYNSLPLWVHSKLLSLIHEMTQFVKFRFFCFNNLIISLTWLQFLLPFEPIWASCLSWSGPPAQQTECLCLWWPKNKIKISKDWWILQTNDNERADNCKIIIYGQYIDCNSLLSDHFHL